MVWNISFACTKSLHTNVVPWSPRIESSSDIFLSFQQLSPQAIYHLDPSRNSFLILHVPSESRAGLTASVMPAIQAMKTRNNSKESLRICTNCTGVSKNDSITHATLLQIGLHNNILLKQSILIPYVRSLPSTFPCWLDSASHGSFWIRIPECFLPVVPCPTRCRFALRTVDSGIFPLRWSRSNRGLYDPFCRGSCHKR